MKDVKNQFCKQCGERGTFLDAEGYCKTPSPREPRCGEHIERFDAVTGERIEPEQAR